MLFDRKTIYFKDRPQSERTPTVHPEYKQAADVIGINTARINFNRNLFKTREWRRLAQQT